MQPTTLPTVTLLIGELAKLALYAYAIRSGASFLTHWLDTRVGMPLFNTSRLTREQAVDAARRYGITNEEVSLREKVAA